MKFNIPSDLKKIKEVSQQVLQCLNKGQVGESFLFDVKLACEEAMINAIKYGNKSKLEKTVNIECDLTKGAVIITVEDEGYGFDYRNLPNPTQEENILKGGGRGLFLIREKMDKVEFNKKGNKITMTKFFSKPKEGDQ